MISTREVKKNTAATVTSICLDCLVIISNLLVRGVAIGYSVFLAFSHGHSVNSKSLNLTCDCLSQFLGIGLGGRNFFDDPPVEKNQHTIGHHQNFIQLR